MNLNKYALLVFLFSFFLVNSRIYAQQDSIPTKKIIRLHYYCINNGLQYLLLESLTKRGTVLTPQKDKDYILYLDSGTANLVAKMHTDEEGKAKAFIPPALKEVWDGASHHSFTVKAGDDEVVSDFIINKAKISLDTSNVDGVRNIIVTVMKQDKGNWIPAKDVELKIGVQRMGSILSGGDAETYTTDSSGTAKVEYKKDKLPGDTAGNIILMAKAEDNDQFGNLIIDKKVNWGVPIIINNDFFKQRTLWSTRFHTPFWLLIMAYSIVIGVWGTLIYLVFQIVKIKKLGV